MPKTIIKILDALLCLLASAAFANEDCPEADISASEELVIQIMATGIDANVGKGTTKQLIAEAIKTQLKDCKERPYAYTFKKLDESKTSIFSDTMLIVEKIDKVNTIRELSEDELKLYPKNKIKTKINENSYYSYYEPDTIYYIDTVYYDTTWAENIVAKGYLYEWSTKKPFFSAFSLDEYSKQQWMFEKKYEKYEGEFIADEITMASKQDMKLKLQAKGFRDEISTLLSYADKNQIGVYYYKSTAKTPYALVVAKRKYAKYISGSFFNEL